MKNLTYLIIGLFFLSLSSVKAQTLPDRRFIEVVGSAEMEIAPDEIQLIIKISEYWAEEFDKKKDYKDYRTKVSIDHIEEALFSDLKKLGVDKKDITLRDVGNYWRYWGREALIGKEYLIQFSDFEEVDKIINSIKTKGIEYIRLGDLKHKNILEFRKQTKINALKAAEEKAKYLLESVNKKIKDIISIEEINSDGGSGYYYPAPTSNTMLSQSYETAGSGSENFRKMKIRYEMRVKFEIQ